MIVTSYQSKLNFDPICPKDAHSIYAHRTPNNGWPSFGKLGMMPVTVSSSEAPFGEEEKNEQLPPAKDSRGQ